MLTSSPLRQSGYTILEALIATSMTAIISAGLWQLVAATSRLARSSFIESQTLCEVPQCSGTNNLVTCSCGQQQYTIIR